MLNIVLVHPLIPQNTGSTGRLAAATNSVLHLIEPLGFELSDRYLKRAGLDYWSEIKLVVHKSWDDFIKDSVTNTVTNTAQLWFLTKKSDKPYYEAKFSDGDFLVFGSETEGLPLEIHERYHDQRLKIPMENSKVRSLNLATSVGIVLYEARRQIAHSALAAT